MIFGFRLGDIDLHVIVELAGRLPLAAAAGACLWIDIVMNQLIFGNVVRKLAKLAVMFAVRFLATVLFRVAVGRFLPIWLGPIVLAALAKLGFEFLDAGVALGERRIALGERFAKLLDLGIALGERLAKFGELEFELARPVVRVLGAIHDALICATMSQSTKSNLLNCYLCLRGLARGEPPEQISAGDPASPLAFAEPAVMAELLANRSDFQTAFFQSFDAALMEIHTGDRWGLFAKNDIAEPLEQLGLEMAP